MVGPDLFERAQRSPETLTPVDKLVFGVASIQGAMSQEAAGLAPEQRTRLLNAAIGVTRQGLGEIRTNPQFSEAERFRYAAVALGRVDWRAMETTPEMAGLLGETMLTLAAGQRTRIQERIGELHEGIISGFYEMSALLMLGNKREELSAVDQVRQLQDADLHTPDQRRTIAVTWAKRLTGEVDDEQFGEMITYFGKDKNDMPAVMDLTMAKFEVMAKEQNSQPST